MYVDVEKYDNIQTLLPQEFLLIIQFQFIVDCNLITYIDDTYTTIGRLSFCYKQYHLIVYIRATVTTTCALLG